MHPLLIQQAGPPAETPPPAMSAEAPPAGASSFATLMKDTDGAATVDVAPPAAIPDVDEVGELVAGDGEKRPVLGDEAVAIQVVLPETAKVPDKVAEARVITVKSDRAVAALVDARPGKLVIDQAVQETNLPLREGPPMGQLRRSTAISGPAQAIFAAREAVAMPTKVAEVLDARQRPLDPEMRLASPPAGGQQRGKPTQLDGATVSANLPKATLPPTSLPTSAKAILPEARPDRDFEPRSPTAEPKSPSPNAQAPALPAAATLQTGMTTPKAFTQQMEDIEKMPSRGVADVVPTAFSEGRASMSVASGTGAQHLPPEVARHVAHQISTAISGTQGRATEIALNPEELGRVKMKLTATEGAVTLVLLADRPETSDLLRRHIDVLAQEFRAIGYDSISFSFGSEQHSKGSDQDDGVNETRDFDTMQTEPDQGQPVSRSTGLDLRV